MLSSMVPDVFLGVLADRVGQVEVVPNLIGCRRLATHQAVGIEVADRSVQISEIRIEPEFQWISGRVVMAILIQVPFPAQVSPIASILQAIRDGEGLGLQSISNGHLLPILACQKGSPRSPALGGVVEVCVAQTVLGQLIQIWGFNLSAKTADVGVPQVVGENDDYVRPVISE